MAPDSREPSVPASTPTPILAKLHHLQQPEKLDVLLAEDKKLTDCLPCRVMGAGAFIGLGTYTYISGHSQLRQQEEVIRKSRSLFGMRSRRGGISGIAAVLVGLGLWRLVN